MSKERRNFERRKTAILAAVETADGQVLDPTAGVLDLSVNGLKLTTSAGLEADTCYRAKLAKTDDWFEFVVRQRDGNAYHCRIETPWEDLYEVIRQSDDLTLLVLGSSAIDDSQP